MKSSFIYEGKNIEFQLILKKRKTMEISIEPPNKVTVKAPLKVPEEKILEKVKEKGAWILKKLEYYKEVSYREVKKEYKAGELFMYLGKTYPLTLIIDPSIKKPKVHFYEEKLCVTVLQANKEVIREAIKAWYKEKAREKIEERVAYYEKYFQHKPTKITIKDQKKRWGSCTYNNELLFNLRCVMAPLEALDYVVVHEMCHMQHKNHSKDFWQAVESILPNYKSSKEWFKKHGFTLEF